MEGEGICKGQLREQLLSGGQLASMDASREPRQALWRAEGRDGPSPQPLKVPEIVCVRLVLKEAGLPETPLHACWQAAAHI